MAGGTWTTQNKILPGVYTNIIGEGPKPSVLGDRGVVALPVVLPWFPEHTVMTLEPADAARFVTDFGSYAVPVREAMKKAALLYFYRLNSGVKATATVGNLLCTAKYTGTFGNRLKVSVENRLGGGFSIVTWLDAKEVDRQTVETITEVVSNDWLDFSALEGATLQINAGVSLLGGTDGTVTNSDYAAFLSAIETHSFDAIACTSSETDVKNLFVAFVKRMINDEGRYMQGVIPDIATADFEGIISVKNGVYLEGGEHVPNTIACAYIAGATAAVPLSESLTEALYQGAVDVDRRYTTSEQKVLASTGQMVFIPSGTQSNKAIIQKDINTLTTFDDTHTYAMSKNKVIRIIHYLANGIDAIGRNWFIGKTPNDEVGRSQLHRNLLTDLFRELERQRALRDVTPEDIVVNKGVNIDAVTVDYSAKVVDVIEIIYNTIRVKG